ncbi:hypothetical protein PR202_ga16549 [Eleusine coracana subsp. coracana]|uniref:Uncharacterized protein n=1 Tax=Eleusine coracana subsp. coracana TaxID=191504 RepID=A0AAV5CN57_ELECO|nr:hypothetical protein PR202_ga16549 [Eleusine coracana subsp. coracana]
MRPVASDKARLLVLVRTSDADFFQEVEELPARIGAAWLATHTTVSFGMLLYQMPRYNNDELEPGGEKKPRAKAPPSEMSVVPGNSGLPRTIWLSAVHNIGHDITQRTVAMYGQHGRSIKQRHLMATKERSLLASAGN